MNDMVLMEITKEMAEADLEKLQEYLETIGIGSKNDRAAKLVLQTLGVLEGRLDNPKAIKMLYMDNLEAQKIIPQTVYNVAQQYTDGSIDEEQAREYLHDVSIKYGEVFQDMGITPKKSFALLFKQ